MPLVYTEIGFHPVYLDFLAVLLDRSDPLVLEDQVLRHTPGLHKRVYINEIGDINSWINLG